MAETLPQKLYFRIGEVAGIVGVEPHVLRYWEREFRSIRPTKSARGQRVYSRRDVENLLRVRELLYTQGFTIAGARKQLQRPGAAVAAEDRDTDTEVLVTSHGGSSPPPISAAPASSPEPERAPNEGSLRETLVALRDEVSTFLDELA
ncbi:MAG TPA: MerR family transcriptional regulator [Polyangiaceae bacterium]|jgi:DNA-binding transcriptional MerR regulator